MISHNEAHQSMMRALVEGRLLGEEKAQAERNLLSCHACLEEFNWYDEVWGSMNNPEGFARWARHLREKDPSRYELYDRALERLSEHRAGAGTGRAAASGYGFSLSIWRNVAFALGLILVLVIPLSVYKVVTLQKAMDRQGAYYRNLLAETEKKNQRPREEPPVEALRRKVDELSAQTQKQTETIAELNQRLEKYVKPRTNAVLAMQFFATRRPDVPEIQVPKDKLFLNFQIGVPEEQEYPTYSLVIADRLGKAIWQDDRIKKDANGNFDLLVEKSFLPPGEYALQIYGVRGETRHSISQIRFRIR